MRSSLGQVARIRIQTRISRTFEACLLQLKQRRLPLMPPRPLRAVTSGR
jgi:hypothetical protein